MAKHGIDFPHGENVDETAAEFLRAQEVRCPSTVEELHQATESANEEVERVLFRRDRWRGMKEEDDESEGSSESLYDKWIEVALDLEEAFIDENEGALGKHVLELLTLDDAAFAPRVAEVRSILQQTTSMALQVYPFTHRLVDLGVGSSRAEVVERLSSGDLVRQEKIHNVSVTPRRRTIIGLLRDLDARLPSEKQTHIWSLEVAPELPTAAVISDPFQSGNENLSHYWRQKISVAHETYGDDTTILSLSGEKTMAVMYELENIAEQAGDEVLKHAAKSIATWLEGKQIYYTDPDPRDFELYHLGMEDPQQLMEILRSLDVIKHLDPELFFELIGIDPSQGGRSLYFGSFLHKALFNTQRTLDHASPELGEMALQTMMSQLLTLDERVQTYSGVVSQESLKAMAGEIKKSVDSAATPESKAQTLMMMAIPYSRMAIDAEVRRQLYALREASPENVAEELHRRIDDIEHPLKLAEYLMQLPMKAVDDVTVRRELRKILSNEQIQSGDFRRVHLYEYGDNSGKRISYNFPSILPLLYQRIPLIDEGRDDLGFALRIRVAIRDALSLASVADELRTGVRDDRTRARKFLDLIMPNNLYREDFEEVQDEFSFWGRGIAERFPYASRVSGEGLNIHAQMEIILDPKWSKEDRAFQIGQMMLELEKNIPPHLMFGSENNTIDGQHDLVIELFQYARDERPDLVFLSIMAHSEGKWFAFKYFDKFCELISAERMAEILRLQNNSWGKFEKIFENIYQNNHLSYVNYLFHQIPKKEVKIHEEELEVLNSQNVQAEHVPILRKIRQYLMNGGSPWQIKIAHISGDSHKIGYAWRDYGELDLFEIYRKCIDIYKAIHNSRGGIYDDQIIKFQPPIKNPDIDPPSEELLNELRSCYTRASRSFDDAKFEQLLQGYFLNEWSNRQPFIKILLESIRFNILKANKPEDSTMTWRYMRKDS